MSERTVTKQATAAKNPDAANLLQTLIIEVEDNLAGVRHHIDTIWGALEELGKPEEKRTLSGNLEAGREAIFELLQLLWMTENTTGEMKRR